MKTNKKYENRRKKFDEVCEQLAFNIEQLKKNNVKTTKDNINKIRKKYRKESKLPEAIRMSNWFQKGWRP